MKNILLRAGAELAFLSQCRRWCSSSSNSRSKLSRRRSCLIDSSIFRRDNEIRVIYIQNLKVLLCEYTIHVCIATLQLSGHNVIQISFVPKLPNNTSASVCSFSVVQHIILCIQSLFTSNSNRPEAQHKNLRLNCVSKSCFSLTLGWWICRQLDYYA